VMRQILSPALSSPSTAASQLSAAFNKSTMMYI
jgi:hypothetical protein